MTFALWLHGQGDFGDVIKITNQGVLGGSVG